jgi:hypothetical protein
MADEEFEIDIYGDAGNEHGDARAEDVNVYEGDDAAGDGGDHYVDDHQPDNHDDGRTSQQPQQGVKRKTESDDRPVDPGATSALLVSELNWWNTDDDIRGWTRSANCEDELKDITFSEHKVNGKSKG